MIKKGLNPISRILCIAFILLGSNFVSFYAGSTDGEWTRADYSKARLIVAGKSSNMDEKNLTVGVHIFLEEGWETYWRSPGEEGLPPNFDWGKSNNISNIELKWPLPEKLVRSGITAYGYQNEVIFPAIITVTDPTVPVELHLDLKYVVCRKICIPVRIDLLLDIPDLGDGASLVHTELIERFKRQVPVAATFDSMSVERVILAHEQDLFLEILARARTPFIAPEIIIEGPPGVTYRDPQVRLLAGGRRAIFRIGVSGQEKIREILLFSDVLITLISGDYAVERLIKVEPDN